MPSARRCPIYVTVESTALAMVVYDEARELLQLEFCSWAVGLYFEVAAAVHQALLDLPSKTRCRQSGEPHGTHPGAVAGRWPDYGLYKSRRDCQVLSRRENPRGAG